MLFRRLVDILQESQSSSIRGGEIAGFAAAFVQENDSDASLKCAARSRRARVDGRRSTTYCQSRDEETRSGGSVAGVDTGDTAPLEDVAGDDESVEDF
jgi:hypothetical protein